MHNITGKRVLITGGAGGLGKALAQKLSAMGARVAIADADPAALKATSRELGIKGYSMDVTNPDSILKVRRTLLTEFGGLDILINNAGVVFGGSFADSALEHHTKTYQVNALGPVNVTHAFFESICAGPEGHIVFVASASGYIGLPFGSSYASSKWAVIGFAESIRLELKEQKRNNVHITTVCPSYIDTGMFTGASAPFLTPILHTEDVAEKIVQAILRKRTYVNLPWIVNWIQTLRGVLPLFVFDFLMRSLKVSQSMMHWKGRT
ncbi:MAG: SDR family NAD(P)-dependent oxidoreductase [Spirochaetia bacterium]|nr:SDR family NAD(P)-dependent oxidoreductase [Spirochaetia bacterium]